MRISKDKMQFAKGFEENWTLEVFKISKVLRRSPRHLYKLENLRGESIDEQFYAEELTPVTITKKTEYLVDKILDSRVRRGIREHWSGGEDTAQTSKVGSPLPISDYEDDDVLPHSTERSVT